MAQLNTADMKEILDMLEDELNFTPRLDKIEKMKMRSKIRKQMSWLLECRNQIPEAILKRLEARLPEVFSLYSYGFRDELKDFLEKKARLRSVRISERQKRVWKEAAEE